MKFCTSCGKEVDPGTKFCENCGTPLESALPPASPELPEPAQSRPAPPAPPGTGSPKSRVIIAVVAVICVIGAALFFGLPLLKGTAGSGSGLPAGAPVRPVTLNDQESAGPALSSTPSGITAGAVQRTEGRYETSYEQVYTLDQGFMYGQKVNFDHDLTRPPLYIKFDLTPGMVSREKLDPSTGMMVNATYANPNSWFEVKVLNAATGEAVDARGFNREYNGMTKQEFMVRSPGNYRVQLSGNDVRAHVVILIGNS